MFPVEVVDEIPVEAVNAIPAFAVADIFPSPVESAVVRVILPVELRMLLPTISIGLLKLTSFSNPFIWIKLATAPAVKQDNSIEPSSLPPVPSLIV